MTRLEIGFYIVVFLLIPTITIFSMFLQKDRSYINGFEYLVDFFAEYKGRKKIFKRYVKYTVDDLNYTANIATDNDQLFIHFKKGNQFIFKIKLDKAESIVDKTEFLRNLHKKHIGS